MIQTEFAYRYQAPSRAAIGADRADLLLATSGGSGAHGPEANPRFFAGFIERPAQAAAALLAVARVARTRFYTPPGMVAAAIRAADPVVTSNGDRLRFEGFAACGGVYARLDLLPASLDRPPTACGTTNVDVNPPTREVLSRIGDVDPLWLEVGAEAISVATLDGSAEEKRVPLPERWLRGFAEVQLVSATMTARHTLTATAARRFLHSLPRNGPTQSAPLWAVPARDGLRLTPRPAPGAICLAGPQRLRPLEPLLRFATGLHVYGPPADGTNALASAWQLDLPVARLVVVLSPEVSRGHSGEGAVLHDLADERVAADAELIAALLAFDATIDPARLAREAGIEPDRVVPALNHLSAAGKVGYDLATGAYFHRELPYGPDAFEAAHPRLRDARALVAAGAVERDAAVTRVRSGDVVYVVRRTDRGETCTCVWWAKHQGQRGPCKHVLAARLA